MSETRITPGPWKSKPLGFATFIYSDDQPNIAAVHSKDSPEGQANALLIAAAPDLLECVRELSESIRRTEYGVRHMLGAGGPLEAQEWKERDPERYGMWERASDAIAKAEGR